MAEGSDQGFEDIQMDYSLRAFGYLNIYGEPSVLQAEISRVRSRNQTSRVCSAL